MAFKLGVAEHGAAEAARAIERIGQNAVHARPAMVKISALLLAGEVALWKRSGGKKWAPRADGSKPGVLSGDLERSLTEVEATGAVREVHDDHVIFGTSIWYGKFMLGTKHQPPRPILVYRPTDRKATKTIIALHLVGEFP
jgi:hypothetical protein